MLYFAEWFSIFDGGVAHVGCYNVEESLKGTSQVHVSANNCLTPLLVIIPFLLLPARAIASKAWIRGVNEVLAEADGSCHDIEGCDA